MGLPLSRDSCWSDKKAVVEQTVTVIKSNGYNYELFDSELKRVQEHVSEMTRDGWMLVSTVRAGNIATTPIMMFWRRD